MELFGTEAFAQIPGQMALDTDERTQMPLSEITDEIRRDVRRQVAYIRERDCDFLTADTLSAYTGHSIEACRAAMLEMGMDARLVG